MTREDKQKMKLSKKNKKNKKAKKTVHIYSPNIKLPYETRGKRGIGSQTIKILTDAEKVDRYYP